MDHEVPSFPTRTERRLMDMDLVVAVSFLLMFTLIIGGVILLFRA